MRRQPNQHEWGVVAQCKNPYREFAYCPLCGKYQESGRIMGKREFKSLSRMLRYGNPMYEPDSNVLLEVR